VSWLGGRDSNPDTMVQLKDGRTLTVPLEWFPRLRDAPEGDRRNYELYADGYAIHWPTLDEDISIPASLACRIDDPWATRS